MPEHGLARIEDFPDYVIDRDGSVFSERTGRQRRTSTTRNGVVKVTLFRDGEPYTKSLALLVAKAYLYNDWDPEIFNTPIHLDNDHKNNHVDNLAWRPRWFAVKYQTQYWKPEFRHATTRVREMRTGIVYPNLVEPCQIYGLLYMDVIASCTRGQEVFPTWQKFSFA